MAGDAGALFAERFLGDLDDDILTGLQHFGNELRTARWTGASALVTAIVPWAAGTTGTAFETPTGASPARRTAGTWTAIAAAAIIAATVAATAAEGPLETRSRICAANAR